MKSIHVWLFSLLFTCTLPAEDPDPASEQDLDVFYGNPYEKEERKARREEYRQLYEEELADEKLLQKMLLRQVFAPRVNDELFDTNLPGVRQKGQWSISLNPKFADFLDDDYVRFPFGIRYNPSRYFEVFTDFGGYFPNPFGDGSKAGLYNWRFGGKYSWMGVGGTRFNIAPGFTADIPVMNPPVELGDGYARYLPYVSISRHLRNHPRWLVFLNLAYQFLENTPFRAVPILPQPRDRLFVRPGFIYYPGGNFRYSFELEYRTNALDFRKAEGPVPSGQSGPAPGFGHAGWVLAYREVHEVIAYPSITWFPQKEIRDGLFIPGNWDVGIQLSLPLKEETGEDWGLSLRFRWYYDYRKLLARDIPSLFTRSGNGD
ncbi:MAG: hypothetical protein ACP5I4_14330 [Oceanipulchritudo sp.]